MNPDEIRPIQFVIRPGVHRAGEMRRVKQRKPGGERRSNALDRKG